ncbi:MAG: geranylgeranyl reductase family protein [Taibaiella sp.]|nr:geranylgeranyl reductase family protein [Taibaiella sp.]
MPSTKSDIIIAGAGPAGTTCALALAEAGLSVALIDKASFPRDKVCGDAIPGRAVKTLYSLNPKFKEEFLAFPLKLQTRSTALYYRNRELSFNWVGEAYTSARLDFDNFLFSLVRAHTGTTILQETEIKEAQQGKEGFTLTTSDGRTLNCKLLIAADGANSTLARKLINRTINRNNHVGSVRAYYSNVTTLNPHTTEVYFLEEFLPSYLWIFPLPDNRANVGFGMLSSEISRRKLDLKKLFYEFIERSPKVSQRLQGAIQEGPLQGFGLPLGGRRLPISGSNYMLTGDAASIIDPMSGDGIGNAMVSGKLAAAQALQCFATGNFSAQAMQKYDAALYNTLGSELRLHLRTRNALARMPFLLNGIFALAGNRHIKRLVQKAL